MNVYDHAAILDRAIQLMAIRRGVKLIDHALVIAGQRRGTVRTCPLKYRGWLTGEADAVLSLESAPPSLQSLGVHLLNLPAFPFDYIWLLYPLETPAGCRTEQLSIEPCDLFVSESNFAYVLPLAPDFAGFLAGLGSHTRRNLRICRKQATGHAWRFTFEQSGRPDPTVLRRLDAANIPCRYPKAALSRIEDYALRQERPFFCALGADQELPLSLARGYIAGDTAYLLYQLNDGQRRQLSPCLALRGFLIERLIALGVAHLEFVGGCCGILRHACVPTTVRQMRIIRTGRAARLKMAVAHLLAPRSRVAQLRRELLGPPMPS